ncbi:MAG: hypothetical protein E3J72_06430 [Planctomycetota bacterium]|nr:MAG: hypothetical protein E3J72_06430 [Planctomycetota bacterium]
MSLEWKSIFSRLSTRDKIAQLIVPKIEGLPSGDDEEYRKLLSLSEEFSFGGYIVFRGAVETTTERINALVSRSKTPPLFMSDLERGPGQQIMGMPELPQAMAFAATGDTELAYLAGELTGKAACTVGIPMVLAPVLDVLTNPENPIIGTRAYSDDPGMVAEFAYRFAHGVVLGGGLPTLKHFPGHGDTSVDSHVELPVMAPTRERLLEVELLPYRRIMRHFRNAIMVGHLAVDSLSEEPGIPATCSQEIVAGLLNRDLDYGGLIITDALIMDAYTKKFSLEEALKRTLLSGHDLLLYPRDPMKVIRKLIGLVQDGVLPISLIDRSVRKILAWKEVMGLLHGAGQACVIESGMDGEYGSLARTTLERALTLVRDVESLVPLPEASHLLAVTIDDDGPDPAPYSEKPDTGLTLAHELSETNYATDTLRFTPDLTDDEVESLLGISQNYGTAVVGVFATPKAWAGRGVISARAAAILSEINRLVERTIVIIFGNPHIYQLCEGAETVLCIYDNSETAEQVAADALLGRIPIKGRLPVTLSDELPRGFGIKRNLE